MQDKEQQENSASQESLQAESVDSVLRDLPKEKRDVIYSAFYAIERSYSGPLPPPDDFANYERTLPGSMDRILTMTEKQVDHRIEKESHESKLDGRGQILGAALVAFFGLMSFLLAILGHDDVALGMGVTTVISVAVIFVLNKVPVNVSCKK